MRTGGQPGRLRVIEIENHEMLERLRNIHNRPKSYFCNLKKRGAPLVKGDAFRFVIDCSWDENTLVRSNPSFTPSGIRLVSADTLKPRWVPSHMLPNYHQRMFATLYKLQDEYQLRWFRVHRKPQTSPCKMNALIAQILMAILQLA